MKLLCYSLALSSLISFVSCDSSGTDQAANKQEPLRLEIREDEKEVADEGKAFESAPLDLPVPGESTVAPESTDTPEVVVDYDYFHKALSPMGTWYETNEYGPVWQPLASREVNWAPYTRGQWVYSDQEWTWVSSEDFGWATYHYGRWAKLQTQGWVWVPGTELAPNWCSWRSNDSYIGWAPLPPETLAFPDSEWDSSVERSYGITASCYSFVQSHHFDRSIASYCLPVSQTTTCFNATRNITRIRFHNNRILYGGPVYRDLSGRLGRRLPFCQIRRSRDFSSLPVSVKHRNRVDGNDLIVNAPKVRSTGQLQTRAQKIAVEVQRSKDTDPRAIEAFRQMRQLEAGRVRNRNIAEEAGQERSKPDMIRPEPRSRATGRQPSPKANEDANAQRNVQTEIIRRQQQDEMARQQTRARQEAVQREAARHRKIEEQRRQREVARRQQEEEEERQAIAAQRSAREAMQRKQREAAQRKQEEEERRQRIAEQKRQREVARRNQEAEEQRQKIAAQQRAREEMQRRQREEVKRQKEAEEQRRRIEKQKKQREEAARRRMEEAARQRKAEEQRQRIEEQRRQREEMQRRQREETERQRKKADPSRRRGK